MMRMLSAWFSAAIVLMLVVSLAPAHWASASAQNSQADIQSDALLELAGQPWKGDLDGMIDRGFIRVLTAYNPIYFSYNGDAESGLAADISREFQKRIVQRYGKKGKPLTIIMIPVPRNELIPRLLEGRGDIIVANLTVTAERAKQVQFSDPVYKNVKEVVVTSKTVGAVKDLDDLVSHGLALRPSSSYSEHLLAINASRKAAGKAEIKADAIDEVLEDYDILELVNAGTIPATVVDSHKVQLWAQVFDNIIVNENVFLNEGGEIAWALRPDTPKLLEGVNRLVGDFRKGSLLGNILIKRYLKNTQWILNNLDDASGDRFNAVVDVIKDKADKYGFDWLMIASQGYQESRLDQSKRSHVGAVGIMQVMPATAQDPVVGISDIEREESNIEAGVKYLDWLRRTYFDDPNMSDADKALMAFAAYNAGPGNLLKARSRAEKMGLNPNVWFGNVEVAAARSISREPVVYVRNIMKYYVAYKRAQDVLRTRK